MRVFVAGATGAIGQPLIADLLQQGHSVIGMTTSEAGAATLQRQGAEVRPRQMCSTQQQSTPRSAASSPTQ